MKKFVNPLFITILFHPFWSHKLFLLGGDQQQQQQHQEECEQNDFVNGLANLLHSMGVGFPVLSTTTNQPGSEVVLKLNLTLLIQSKYVWPNQPMDIYSKSIANSYGIPVNSHGIIDMQKIATNGVIKRLAKQFGTLECTQRHFRPARSAAEHDDPLQNESDQDSNPYLSKSGNNYWAKSQRIFDRESANEHWHNREASGKHSSSFDQTTDRADWHRPISQEGIRITSDHQGRPSTNYANNDGGDQNDRNQKSDVRPKVKGRARKITTYVEEGDQQKKKYGQPYQNDFFDQPAHSDHTMSNYEERNKPTPRKSDESSRSGHSAHEKRRFESVVFWKTMKRNGAGSTSDRNNDLDDNNDDSNNDKGGNDSMGYVIGRGSTRVANDWRTANKGNENKMARNNEGEKMPITKSPNAEIKAQRTDNSDPPSSSPLPPAERHALDEFSNSSRGGQQQGKESSSSNSRSSGRQTNRRKKYADKTPRRRVGNHIKMPEYYQQRKQSPDAENDEDDFLTAESSSSDNDAEMTAHRLRRKLLYKKNAAEKLFQQQQQLQQSVTTSSSSIHSASLEDKLEEDNERRQPEQQQEEEEEEVLDKEVISEYKEITVQNIQHPPHHHRQRHHQDQLPNAIYDRKGKRTAAADDYHHQQQPYTSAQIASSTLPVIECDHMLGRLNAFVSVLYALHVPNSKVLCPASDRRDDILLFDLNRLMSDGTEWAAIERCPLDTVQLAYAEQNLVHIKPIKEERAGSSNNSRWKDKVPMVLNVAAFINEPFFSRLLTNGYPQIACQIIDLKGKEIHQVKSKQIKPIAATSTNKANIEQQQQARDDDAFLANLMQPKSQRKNATFLQSEQDCNVVRLVLKHWFELKETNKIKRIELFITQNFMGQTSEGRQLVEKMETKNRGQKLLAIVEQCVNAINEKDTNDQRTFVRRISDQFSKLIELFEQTLNEQQCKKMVPNPTAASEKKNRLGETRIDLFWEDNNELLMGPTKSGRGRNSEDEKPMVKLAKQLIEQLRKLRERYNEGPKKGRLFIALLEDFYFECSSSTFRHKINKINETLKWGGLREAALSLRQRKSAMVNAWRRVVELRITPIMADLVERADEALDAVDRLLQALQLIAIDTNLKEAFERLDAGEEPPQLINVGGDGDGGGGDQTQAMITNNADDNVPDLSEIGQYFTKFELNRLFQPNPSPMKVSSILVQQLRLLFRAAKRAIVDNKHEIHGGGIWDIVQSRKFEMPEIIYNFVKANNKNGIADRLLAFMNELNRVTRYDMVKMFADQVDFYRDDPRETVHEMWQKFMNGIDWVHRLHYGRKMVQFILYLHRKLPKHSLIKQLKGEGQREQLDDEEMAFDGTTGGGNDQDADQNEGKSNAGDLEVIKRFSSLELETIYRKVKEQLLAQFKGWWKRVPEQKEPLYEFYTQLDAISTRFVMFVTDAFLDGISIDMFRQELSLSLKDIKLGIVNDRTIDDEPFHLFAKNVPTIGNESPPESSSSPVSTTNKKLTDRTIVETKAFFDHFFTADQAIIFDKESGRFQANNFIRTFDKSFEITAFITKGFNKIFKWSRKFLHELTAELSNNFDEMIPLHFFNANNENNNSNKKSGSGNGKKKKLRKPLQPVLSKQTLNSIVKVIRKYELEFNKNNTSQLSDQMILDMHWRKVREGMPDNKRELGRKRHSHSTGSSTTDNPVIDAEWLSGGASGTDGTGSATETTLSTDASGAILLVVGEEVQMNEQQRMESLKKIDALVYAKRLLTFAIILRRKYARVETGQNHQKMPSSSSSSTASSLNDSGKQQFRSSIDTAFFAVLRDIRIETERWVPGKRNIGRLYRVCRHLNRMERAEITKLVDAFWDGAQNVDKVFEKKRTKQQQQQTKATTTARGTDDERRRAEKGTTSSRFGG